MKAIRPDRWTADRSEPEDETVRKLRDEVKELKRIASARPQIELRGFVPDVPVIGRCEFARSFHFPAYQARLRGMLEAAFPLPTSAELLRQYGRPPSINGRYISVFGAREGCTDPELEEWRNDVETFHGHFDRIDPTELQRRLQYLSIIRVVDLDLANTGSAAEDDVQVDVRARANARLVSADDYRNQNDWGLRELEPPSPPTNPFEIPNYGPFNFAPRDQQAVYLNDGDKTFQDFRLKTLLHGVERPIRVFVLPDDSTAESRLLLTVRSRHLIDPLVREIRLMPQVKAFDADDIDNLILDRLELMPEKQSEVLSKALAVIRR